MNRERLTITLRSDLLKTLDSLIDGERLRNRSHAIEYFLARALGVKSMKVLILAGGKPVYPHTFDVKHWEGLGKETTTSISSNSQDKKNKGVGVYFESEKKALPKAMVKIAGKPLLEQTLHHLKTAKFTEIIISIGEGGEKIQQYFGDGSGMGLKITYIKQKDHFTGNAQPLLQAKDALGSGDFLLLYGDVLSDLDYNDLVEFHRAQKSSLCTMALTSTEAVNMWGLARLAGSRVVEFEEKPKNPKTFSRLINAGIYVMDSEIFKYIHPHPGPLPGGEGGKKACEKLESEVFPRLAEEGKLYGYPYEGLWLDISNSAAYKQALRELNKN